jgi:peptidoglycan hydrolase-like protein with peptidoglycan-binding domain
MKKTLFILLVGFSAVCSITACSSEKKPAPEAPANLNTAQTDAAGSEANEKNTTMKVQTALNNDAKAKLVVDGVLGKNTRHALKKFQKKNGIPVSGKVDAETLKKLGIN